LFAEFMSLRTPLTAPRRPQFAGLANSFFEGNGDALFLVEPETEQVCEVNPAAVRLTGLSRPVLLRDKVLNLFSSETPEAASRLRRACQELAELHSQEGYFLRQGRGGRWLLVNLTVSRVVSDAGSWAVIAARDVSGRPLRESERCGRTSGAGRLRDSLQRVLIDNMEQAVYLKDAELRYVLVNDRCCKVLGFAEDAIIGLNDFDLYPPARAERYRAEDQRVLAEGKRVEREESRLVQGRTRTVRVLKTPVKDAEGQITGVLGMSWDVTEQRSLEEQLRQAQKMEAVGQLAGGIAHDFNNLLTAIFGNLSMLRAALSEGDPNRVLIASAEQAAARAGGLSNQLLSMARRTVLNPQSTNLNQTIDEVIGLLHRTIDPRIELAAKREPDLGRVLADASQMHQVLMNLCLNARDAMPDGGRLSIETSNFTLDAESARLHLLGRPGDFVRLRVSDTGCGIPPEIRPRIFEPFFTTKGPGQGTGLGLAMVFSIVKQHQGWIDCYSEPGKGTRFDIYLPRHATPDDTQPAPAASSPPAFGRETILLADDEAVLRDLGRAVLERYGYQVILACDGQEAVEIYRRERSRIDLIILDQTMPRLSGSEALQMLRAEDPTVNVVLSSGYPEPPGDAVGFISKPYRPEDLLAAVRAALDGAKTGA
jgi:two-component system, cell cycle sensor histidine kinase and response regulator CckA